MPRLAVIDAAAVDGRRRLVLVRRDNVEHLLMIGGPTDIVVEPNIVRAMPAREQIPQRPSVGGVELPPRIALPEVSNWSEGDAAPDHPEPAVPDPPQRPARPSFADEVRRPAPATSERRSDPLAGFTPEPMSRTDIREPAQPRSAAPRSEPVIPRPSRPVDPPRAPPVRAPERAAPPPAPSPALSSADQNLAEMAQRLEAALRRPGGDAAEPRVGTPPVQPAPAPSRPRGDQAAAAVAPPSAKGGFENLEDEMASLLGRPKTPS
jgi:hypothetical protein